MKQRTAKIERNTKETKIELSLNLDGSGKSRISTGIGFFDHMLELLARQALIDIEIKAAGDLHVDQHHTVEDVGICLGLALSQAWGNKAGIRRFGTALIPMDESLVRAAVDLCGRGYLSYNVKIRKMKVGEFSTGLAREFFRAVADQAEMVIHLDLIRGEDPHHKLEAAFKAFARALRQAIEKDPRESAVPSSKGKL